MQMAAMLPPLGSQPASRWGRKYGESGDLEGKGAEPPLSFQPACRWGEKEEKRREGEGLDRGLVRAEWRGQGPATPVNLCCCDRDTLFLPAQLTLYWMTLGHPSLATCISLQETSCSLISYNLYDSHLPFALTPSQTSINSHNTLSLTPCCRPAPLTGHQPFKFSSSKRTGTRTPASPSRARPSPAAAAHTPTPAAGPPAPPMWAAGGQAGGQARGGLVPPTACLRPCPEGRCLRRRSGGWPTATRPGVEGVGGVGGCGMQFGCGDAQCVKGVGKPQGAHECSYYLMKPPRNAHNPFNLTLL